MSLETELITWLDAALTPTVRAWDPDNEVGELVEGDLPGADRSAIAIRTTNWESITDIPGLHFTDIEIHSQGDIEAKHKTVNDEIRTRNTAGSQFSPIDLTSFRIEGLRPLTSYPTRFARDAAGQWIYRSAFRVRLKEQ